MSVESQVGAIVMGKGGGGHWIWNAPCRACYSINYTNFYWCHLSIKYYKNKRTSFEQFCLKQEEYFS